MKQLADAISVTMKDFAAAMNEFNNAIRYVHRMISPDVAGVCDVKDYS